jgi:hypothetical protein
MGKPDKQLATVIEEGRALVHKAAPRDPRQSPDERLNSFCTEPPCASDSCRRARRCLHAS